MSSREFAYGPHTEGADMGPGNELAPERQDVGSRVRRFAGLAADDSGESDARPPLVLLHGLTFDRTMWQPALAELRRIDPGRRALAFDLPGHGASDAWESYDIQSVVNGLQQALEEAELRDPVLVGHSLAAIVASLYASQYPTRGVINVDQPLATAAFAEFIQSIEEQLRGPGFPEIWQQFASSMHTDLLPEAARRLAESTTNPRKDLVLGYWREVLDRPVSDLADLTAQMLTGLRTAGVPYLIVAGAELDADYRQWITEVLPQAEITVMPDSGHFPHLAHPAQFAECLAASAH